MPADFTVVYSFQGLTGGDLIGLPSFNAPNQPTVGTNNGDYWVDSGGGNWSLVTNNAGPVAFGMQFSATPEPSVLGLGAMGLAVMAGLIKRRKK